MLRRQRAVEIVPGGEPFRWRRYDVPQHLAPETSDALRFCAVEGDLDLLDRRHRSTIEAGSFVISTGPPLARLWRRRPTRLPSSCHRTFGGIRLPVGLRILWRPTPATVAESTVRRNFVDVITNLKDQLGGAFWPVAIGAPVLLAVLVLQVVLRVRS